VNSFASASRLTPFGWNSVNESLEKNPGQWRWVEMMLNFHQEGKSLHWIASELSKLGIRTQKTVSQILMLNHSLKKDPHRSS